MPSLVRSHGRGRSAFSSSPRGRVRSSLRGREVTRSIFGNNSLAVSNPSIPSPPTLVAAELLISGLNLLKQPFSEVFLLQAPSLYKCDNPGVAYMQVQDVKNSPTALAVSLDDARIAVLKLEEDICNLQLAAREKALVEVQKEKQNSELSALRAESKSIKRMVEDGVPKCPTKNNRKYENDTLSEI